MGEMMSRAKTVFVNLAPLDAAAAPDAEILSDDDPWGAVDSEKWRIRRVTPDGPVPVELSAPVLIIDTGVGVVDIDIDVDVVQEDATLSDGTDLMLLMIADACSAPGRQEIEVDVPRPISQEEPTVRTSQADVEVKPAIPPTRRHPKLAARTSSLLRSCGQLAHPPLVAKKAP